ncbi:MAG: DUF4249 domain-containing protein [Catalinimonas sp.]
MKHPLFILLAAAVALTACEDVVDLDVPEAPPRVVVDGRVTNHLDSQTVRLTYSTPYFDNRTPPPITGATVEIADDEGVTVALTETAPGYYKALFAGTAGRVYTLRFTTPEGRSYTSQPERLNRVTAIDSLAVVNQDSLPFAEDGYYVRLFAQEPGETEDYYFWRWSINGEIEDDPSEVQWAADDFVNGRPIRDFQLNFEPFEVDDEILVEQLGITPEFYEFISILFEQTNRGGLFDPPPAPVPGNVFNVADDEEKVLGYFYAAGYTDQTVIIEP